VHAPHVRAAPLQGACVRVGEGGAPRPRAAPFVCGGRASRRTALRTRPPSPQIPSPRPARKRGRPACGAVSGGLARPLVPSVAAPPTSTAASFRPRLLPSHAHLLPFSPLHPPLHPPLPALVRRRHRLQRPRPRLRAVKAGLQLHPKPLRRRAHHRCGPGSASAARRSQTLDSKPAAPKTPQPPRPRKPQTPAPAVGCSGKPGIETGSYALDTKFVDSHPQAPFCQNPKLLDEKPNPMQPLRCARRPAPCWRTGPLVRVSAGLFPAARAQRAIRLPAAAEGGAFADSSTTPTADRGPITEPGPATAEPPTPARWPHPGATPGSPTAAASAGTSSPSSRPTARPRTATAC
jgi:hypothetical protein